MIRAAERKDREEYVKMAHEFYHSPAVLHPIPDSYIERTFKEYMKESPYIGIYVFMEKEQYVGYALIAKTFSQEAGGCMWWLDELYIREEFRSRGLGREFFALMEQEKGISRFRLEVEEDNEKAIALYKRLGYQSLEYKQMVKDKGEYKE